MNNTPFFATAGFSTGLESISAFDFLAFGRSSDTSTSEAFLFVAVLFGAAGLVGAASAVSLALEAFVSRVEAVVEALAFVVGAAFEATAFFGGIVMVVMVLDATRMCRCSRCIKGFVDRR